MSGKPTIMVVEDERIVAEDIAKSLAQLDYRVVATLASGEEALRQIAIRQPDLVLMDIVLQGKINGIDAADTIRNRFDIPVVYLTAYADAKTLERAKKTVPYGYILKPFEDRELQSTIEMALYKHRMEKKLKENERWLSTILRSIGDGVIVTDRAGRVTFMNPVAESLTGWDDSAKGRLLDEVFHILSESERKPVENPVARVLREGIVVGLANHTLLVSRDGREMNIDDSGSPIRDDRDDIKGVVLVFHDITERRKTEQELQQIRHEESVLLNSVPALISLVDRNGRFKRVNEAFAQAFGVTVDEVCGQSIRQFHPGDSGAQIETTHAEVMRTGKAQTVIEERIDNPDGPVWVSSARLPYLDERGEIAGVISLSVDVTAIQRNQLELVKRNRELESLNTLSTAVGGTLDLDSLTHAALDEAMRIESYPGGALFLFDPESQEPAVQTFRRIPKTLTLKLEDIHRNGSSFRGQLNQGQVRKYALSELFSDSSFQSTQTKSFAGCLVVPIKAGPDVLGSLLLFEKKMQPLAGVDPHFFSSVGSHIGLAVGNARLYQKTHRTLETLRETQDKLIQSEKLAVLGGLTGNVVHEIGNPLAAIMNSVDVLKSRVQLDGKLKELLDIIGWETDRLNRTIEQLREFARPRKLRFIQGDVAAVLRKAIKVLSQDIELVMGRRITTRFTSKLSTVLIDEDAFEDAAINLIKNALQAVKEDGHVEVSLCRKGTSRDGKIVLVIQDNGPGIPDHVRQKIFEPYFSTKARGMGLGMAVVKQIIEAHGGTIAVANREPHGTQVIVELPIKD
jgi:PAS domain S-box-containing protein